MKKGDDWDIFVVESEVFEYLGGEQVWVRWGVREVFHCRDKTRA